MKQIIALIAKQEIIIRRHSEIGDEKIIRYESTWYKHHVDYIQIVQDVEVRIKVFKNIDLNFIEIEEEMKRLSKCIDEMNLI